MPTYVYKIEQVDQRPDGDNLFVGLWRDGVVVDRQQVQIPAGLDRTAALAILEARMAPLVAGYRRTAAVAVGDTITPP